MSDFDAGLDTPGLAERDVQLLKDRGYTDPFDLLTETQCEAVIADANATTHRVSWYKGLHEFDSACAAAASAAPLVSRAVQFLGPEVMLWSTQMMRKKPGEPHRWHCDVEAMEWPTLNGWIGLRNVGAQAHLLIIPNSHQYGTIPQDHASEGIDLFDTTSVLAFARRHDAAAEVRPLVVNPGQAVLFDGKAWHGSQNTAPSTRYALLTQYSPSSAEIRIPTSYERPATWSNQRPACSVVAGSGETPNDVIAVRRALRGRGLHRLHPRALKNR